jgi:hypothetical protein
MMRLIIEVIGYGTEISAGVVSHDETSNGCKFYKIAIA